MKINDTLIDQQLERSLLASLFVNAFATEHMRDVQGIVIAGDFSTDEDKDTWRVLCKCCDDGKELSPINIFAVGKQMGIDINIKRYTTSESLFADSKTLAEQVHAVGQRRRLASRVEDVLMSLLYDFDKTTEQATAELDRIVKDIVTTNQKNCETFGEVYRQLLKQTQDKANGLLPEGVRSGFKLIDSRVDLSEVSL